MEEVTWFGRRLVRTTPVLVCSLLPLPCFAADHREIDKVVYCVKGEDSSWRFQSFTPLIDVHRKQAFVRISFNGNWLRTARVRNFSESHELAFEYRFNQDGSLSARRGYLYKFGDWSAETDLYPGPEGKLPDLRVNYTRGAGNSIAEPEDGRYYLDEFKAVQMYRTIDDLPCAASLKALEKR